MKQSALENFRNKLLLMWHELATGDRLGQDGQRTVTLNQQSVGRLSRMDALQQQAMAKATRGRRALSRNRIAAALDRIETGEFGYCLDCGEEIAQKRLELDPAAPQCVSCAGG